MIFGVLEETGGGEKARPWVLVPRLLGFSQGHCLRYSLLHGQWQRSDRLFSCA